MFPDFLCIGAQKSGTTWLHANLKNHPEVWLPDRKEIHYFDYKFPIADGLRDYQSSDDGLDNKIVKKRESTLQVICNKLKKYNFRRFQWELKYRYKEKNDAWYASLFEQGKGYVTGDFTPAYSMLLESDVSYIKSIMPNTKIIFIMRDPIERAWSQAKMDLSAHSNRNVEDISHDEFIRHFNSDASRLRGDYLRVLNAWHQHFDDDNFLCLFFDELKTDPENLLLKVYKFLGISASKEYIPDTIKKRVHIGESKVIPGKLHTCLLEQYSSDITKLAEMYGKYPARWLNSDVKENSL